MHRAGQAHFFKPRPQCLAASVKSHVDIVQRRTEAYGDPLSRLAQGVGSPDDIGIFRFECWQELIKAVAYHPVDLGVGRDRCTREFESCCCG